MGKLRAVRKVVSGVAFVLICGVAAAQDTTYQDAVAALKAEDYKAAAAGFEALTQQNSTWAPGFLSLGQCYYMLGRADDGRRKLEEAHALDPAIDLYAQYYAVGQTLYSKQAYERAIPPFERALELPQASKPDGQARRAVIIARLAHANLKLERFGEARRLLEAQDQLTPLDARSRHNLAIVCQQLGDYDAALTHLRSLRDAEAKPSEDVLRSLARWSHYWALLPANASRRIALLGQAAADTRGWYDADPSSDDALRMHTGVLLEAGRAEDVVAAVKPRAEANDRDCAARLVLAQAYNARRQAGDAELWSRREIECNAKSVDGRMELAAALLIQVRKDFSSTDEVETDLRRVKEAEDAVRRAAELAPDNRRAKKLLDDVATAQQRLQEVADDLGANDRAHEAALDREQQLEIRKRCRNILWTLRDENHNLSDEDRAYLGKHDCKNQPPP